MMPKINKPPQASSSIVLEFQEQMGPYTRACFKVDGYRVADCTFIDPKDKDVAKLLKKLRESGIKITADVGGKVP